MDLLAELYGFDLIHNHGRRDHYLNVRLVRQQRLYARVTVTSRLAAVLVRSGAAVREAEAEFESKHHCAFLDVVHCHFRHMTAAHDILELHVLQRPGYAPAMLALGLALVDALGLDEAATIDGIVRGDIRASIDNPGTAHDWMPLGPYWVFL